LEVDIHQAERLLAHIPKHTTVVVESGFQSHDDVMKYKSLGVHAFLIGTALMKSEDVVSKLQEILKGGIKKNG